MIDLTIHRQALDRNIQKARESGVVIPTFENMKHPETVPEPIRARLRGVGLWDVDPLNLFRITWKNEPMESGGLYRAVPNYIELPPALTGVSARIIALVGKWFPTGCHKVGASFGCLAPRLVTGQFDAGYHRAVWPSTGNYCRGGAFNSKLLGVRSVAILPAGMSRERFEWLSQIAGEVIATPGCESNVKEIFDKTHELRQEPDCMIFNQFEEMGNHLWHYQVTGSAIAEVFEAVKRPGDRLSGACFTSGSAGTIGCGDYLKEVYPGLKLAVGEALQCPTILENGFGDHRIEGIGDKRLTDGFATGPAVFEDGFALGIKAVDLLDHGGELLFRGGLADGEAVEFVDDGGTPVAQAVNNRFPGGTPQDVQEDAHVADTGQQVDPRIVRIAEMGNDTQQNQGGHGHNTVSGQEKRG